MKHKDCGGNIHEVYRNEGTDEKQSWRLAYFCGRCEAWEWADEAEIVLGQSGNFHDSYERSPKINRKPLEMHESLEY